MTETTPFEWTPGREQLVRDMWAAGKSGSEISAALGWKATRNAVLAKVQRMLRADGADGEDSPALLRAHSLAAAGQRRSTSPVHNRNRHIMPAEPVTLADGPVGGVDFEVMSRERVCAWAINTPPLGRAQDLRFCGAARASEGYYCPAHAERAFDRLRKGAANRQARNAVAKARREGVA